MTEQQELPRRAGSPAEYEALLDADHRRITELEQENAALQGRAPRTVRYKGPCFICTKPEEGVQCPFIRDEDCPAVYQRTVLAQESALRVFAARAESAEQENAALRATAARDWQDYRRVWAEKDTRAESAETRLAKAVEALRKIADYMGPNMPISKLRFGDAANYARAVLKELESPEGQR